MFGYLLLRSMVFESMRPHAPARGDGRLPARCQTAARVITFVARVARLMNRVAVKAGGGKRAGFLSPVQLRIAESVSLNFETKKKGELTP
jgi:hypothetical protein